MFFDRPVRLTSEEIRFYNENGYLVVDGVFSQSLCEKAVEILDYHARTTGNHTRAAVMNIDRTEGTEPWRKYFPEKNHWIHSFFRQEIIKNPGSATILETLHDVAPGNLVVMQSQVIYKTAGTPYAAQAWGCHQDGVYHGAPYNGTLTGNVAFTDQDKENGCLFVFPGSHKIERFLPIEERLSFHEKPGDRPGHDCSKSMPEEFRGKEADVNMRQGSLLVLHGGVIHGSHPNVSKDRNRPMFQAPYKTLGLPFSQGTTGHRMEIPIR